MAITLKYRKIAGDGINDRDNADVDVDENTGAITTAAANLSLGLKNVLIECYEDGNELNSVVRPVTFEVVETPAPTTTTTTTTTTLAPTTTTTTAAPLTMVGTPNANPTMQLTLTFPGGGTESFLNETWNSGDTKGFYSTTYNKTTGALFTCSEQWEHAFGTQKFRMTGLASAAGGYGHVDNIRWAAGSRIGFGTGGPLTYNYGAVVIGSPSGPNPFGGPWTPAYTTPGFELVKNGSAYIQAFQRAGDVTFANSGTPVTVAWMEGGPNVW